MSKGHWVHRVDPDSGEVLTGNADEDLERLRQVELTHDTLQEPIRVLRPRKALCFSPETPVATVLAAMVDGEHISCALVVDNEELVGIFTERDVLLRLHGGRDLTELDTIPVRSVMTTDPTILVESDSLAFALSMMAIGGYRHIPILPDDEHGSGEFSPAVVSARDLIAHLADFFPEEIHNLPPMPVRRGTQRFGA